MINQNILPTANNSQDQYNPQHFLKFCNEMPLYLNAEKIKAARKLLAEIFASPNIEQQHLQKRIIKHSTDLLKQIPNNLVQNFDKELLLLHKAIELQFSDSFIIFLLEKGCNPKYRKTTALHTAIKQGNEDTIKLLLSKIPHSILNIQDSQGNTPFHKVVEGIFDLALIKDFLNYKPDITIRNNKSETALHKAIRTSNLSIVQAILETQAIDLNQVDNRGYSYLHLAARNSHPEIIKLLLHKGANWNIQNMYQKTPFHIALDNTKNLRALVGLESWESLNVFLHYLPFPENQLGTIEKIASSRRNHLRTIQKIKSSYAQNAKIRAFITSNFTGPNQKYFVEIERLFNLNYFPVINAKTYSDVRLSARGNHEIEKFFLESRGFLKLIHPYTIKALCNLAIIRKRKLQKNSHVPFEIWTGIAQELLTTTLPYLYLSYLNADPSILHTCVARLFEVLTQSLDTLKTEQHAFSNEPDKNLKREADTFAAHHSHEVKRVKFS